jgi:lipoprotein signal peptidase
MKAAFSTIFTVLFLDQISKVWVKLSMYQGEQIAVFGKWFLAWPSGSNSEEFMGRSH